ncbi:MAG: ABC transporter permease [Candidatus Moranbacteria bacterium]|nr:ABC transporter permease [Candidatus Moranbacteria bacterium]
MPKNRKKPKNIFKSFAHIVTRSPHEWTVVFRMAFRNLRMNKLRTALTTIGIIIGIMSVIVVMAGGAALKGFVMGQVAAFGSDYIQVEVKVPGTGATSLANASGRATGVSITTLKEEDAKAVAKLPNVAAWAAGNMDQELVAYKGTTKRVILFGVSPSWQQIDAQAEVQEGNFFSEGENNALDQVAVIGSGVRDSFFGLEDPIGKNIKIKGQSYRVVGLAKKRGAAAFLSFDDMIFVPVNTLNKKLLGINYFQFITFKVADTSRMEQTALDIRAVMDKQHKTTDPDKEDFSVVSATEGMQILDSVFGTINYLLLALTSISLLVGGVGIMNVMYVAVTERTREIGLRKALGATNSGILRQFLFEALVVTFLGGVIGILLGIGMTFLLNELIARFGYALIFTIPLQSVLIAVGFSFFTGIIFGVYPAWKASKLSPIEALRK